MEKVDIVLELTGLPVGGLYCVYGKPKIIESIEDLILTDMEKSTKNGKI